MAYLTIRVKDSEGHNITALENADRLTVGRSSSAGVTIPHESISREHCTLIFEDGVWYIEDCGSANGTRVNRDKINGRLALKERDIIRIGMARITFHAGAMPTGRSREDAAISLDDEDVGLAVPVKQLSAGDPPQAIPCTHCGAWFSVAHRLPGDRMPCPRCEKHNTVPSFMFAASV